MRLVVTRPAADAERTAVALRLRGHAVTVAPVLHVESLPGAPISDGPWAAILVTSANAAPAVAAHARFAELRALPVLAVGERSAQAMREAGFADVSSSDGTAGDLVRLAAARPGLGLPLLYLAGEDRSRDIAADLGAQNIPVRTAWCTAPSRPRFFRFRQRRRLWRASTAYCITHAAAPGPGSNSRTMPRGGSAP